MSGTNQEIHESGPRADDSEKQTFTISPIQMVRMRYVIKKTGQTGITNVYVQGKPDSTMKSDHATISPDQDEEKKCSTPNFGEG